MAIVENRASEIGDVLVIKTDVPIIGLIALTDYIDSTVGEDVNKFFTRQFRYASDGLNFSEWIELTTPNIAGVQVEARDNFVIEYRYTRSGTDATGDLQWDSTTLNGEFLEVPCGNAYQESVFAQFFECSDIEVLQWALNVTEKAYKKGDIVKAYIERGADIDSEEDRDFIDFWRTVATYFAFCVVLARKLQNYYLDKDLLLEFLRQRGLFFCGEEMLTQLQTVTQNILSEYRKRGTNAIFKRDNSATNPNGELLRLICFKFCDEFIFQLLDSENFSWNINNCSPMYRGLNGQRFWQKSYEQADDFADLNNYPIFNSTYTSIVTDGSREVLEISGVPNGSFSGIGGSNFSKAFEIDPNVNYEISFYIRDLGQVGNIDFGILAYDVNNTPIQLESIENGASTSDFFAKQSLNKVDTYYQVRGILFANGTANKPDEEDYLLNIGFGNHLRFSSTSICKIIPKIQLNNTDSVGGTLRIWNLRINPLSTEYGRCFLNQTDFAASWIKNNNGSFSNSELQERIKRYLIPYQTTLKTTFL